jgi:hypothetical protein
MPSSDREASRDRLACALDLGWRVAELYALAGKDPSSPEDFSLLPAHQHLPPRERLELQVRAVTGDAAGVDIPFDVEPLVALAAAAAESPDGREPFTRAVRERHVELQIALWERREAEGRAYELGNALSDTWNIVACAYEAGGDDEAAIVAAWRRAFASERVLWLRRLLGDVQAMLDSRAVSTVTGHLNSWCAFVEEHFGGGASPPSWKAADRALRSQTRIWRQLLTADKEPEAFLGPEDRAAVRARFIRLALRSYLRPLPVAATLAAAVLAGLVLANWGAVTDSAWLTWLGGTGAALLGMLGVSRAAVGLALRDGVRRWSALLWERTYAEAICRATLRLGEITPAEDTLSHRVAQAATRPSRAVGGLMRKGDAGSPAAG